MVAMVVSMSRVLNSASVWASNTSPRFFSRALAFPPAPHLRLDHVPDHGGDVGSAELRYRLMPVGEVTLISVR